MDLEIVTCDYEMDVVNRVLDGHDRMSRGDISNYEWMNDDVSYPRKVWLYIDRKDKRMPFVVVDNRDGECFVEQFSSIDGALFYACEVYLTVGNQEAWDYPGAVKDRGNLKRQDACPCI